MCPIYEFTSPEGEKWYGEGADPHEAFGSAEERSPAELAAMRTRQAVRPSGGRQESEFTPMLEEALVPGLGATRSAMRGEYGEAAGKAALSAAPYAMGFIPPLARALGAGGATLFSPSAAGGGMFDAEPDAKKRKALQKMYDEASPKGKREITAKFLDEQSKIQGEQRKVMEEERLTAQGKRRREEWDAENAETIAKLPKDWQDLIRNSGTLPEAREMLNRALEQRRQAGMTLAERYPSAVLGGEALGVVGDVAVPALVASGRAKALGRASEEAERAYMKAYGPGTRASKGAVSEADLRRSMLQERADLPRVDPKELALGTAVPYVAGNLPNAIDMLMGKLSSDPAAQEKADRAFASATDPMQFLRALGVGLGATAIGGYVGGAMRDFGSEQTRARGILNQFSAREETARQAAAKREAAKSKSELAKALRSGGQRSNVESLRPQHPLSEQDRLNIITGGGG